MKIGELAKLSGCPIQTIRHYEKEGLISAPSRTEGNFRVYDNTAVENLLFIRNCRALDLNLSEIKQLIELQHSPNTPCAAVDNMINARLKEVEARINNLDKLRKDLQRIQQQCDNARSVGRCGIIEELTTKPHH